MARRVVQRGAALDQPLPAVPADCDAQLSAFSTEDDAGVEVRTLMLLRLARRWRGAPRQCATQACLTGISINFDDVLILGEMAAILEVFCGLRGRLSAAVLLPHSAPGWAGEAGYNRCCKSGVYAHFNVCLRVFSLTLRSDFDRAPPRGVGSS